MDAARAYWDEEIRSFPHGGGEACLWVVRRDGEPGGFTLRLVFSHRWGGRCAPDRSSPPPLARLLKVISKAQGAEFLLGDAGGASGPPAPAPSGTDRLWVEPLRSRDAVAGAFALRYPDLPPWREAVRLWGARFAARAGLLLPRLDDAAAEGAALAGRDCQPTLFPLPAPCDAAAATPRPRVSRRPPGLPLPRPLCLPEVPGLVGVSREMAACCDLVSRIAASGVNVLLHGESGTGKELVAKALHNGSPRRDRPFIGVNCASLPETLFESELFGHKAGAFTGAAREKTGLLEAADGGTFFLDEIGDMPPALQIKLLRVMQEGRLRRIGELQTRPVDVRFVAASHKDLEAEIEAGRFRLDLYYRLKVVCVDIPPLRRRPEDILPLLAYFLGKHGGRAAAALRVDEEAVRALQRYRWPGNVRELENEARRWLALQPAADLVEVEQLSTEVQRAAGRSVDLADLATLRTLDEAGELLERYLIRKALQASGGMKSVAARRLGLSRQGLYKKIRRYGMLDLLHASG